MAADPTDLLSSRLSAASDGWLDGRCWGEAGGGGRVEMISITLQSWQAARSSPGSEMLGVGTGGYLFIYCFLPAHKSKNKSTETNSRSRSRPAQAPSASEEQQERAADLDAKQPDGAGILLPTSLRPGCKGHCICCCFVCPPLFPLPAGMKACRQALIFKRCKLKPQVSPLGCEPLRGKELPRAPLCGRSQHPKAATGSSAGLPALPQSWGGAHIIPRPFPNPFTRSWCCGYPRSWSTCCFSASQGSPAPSFPPSSSRKTPRDKLTRESWPITARFVMDLEPRERSK